MSHIYQARLRYQCDCWQYSNPSWGNPSVVCPYGQHTTSLLLQEDYVEACTQRAMALAWSLEHAQYCQARLDYATLRAQAGGRWARVLEDIAAKAEVARVEYDSDRAMLERFAYDWRVKRMVIEAEHRAARADLPDFEDLMQSTSLN